MIGVLFIIAPFVLGFDHGGAKTLSIIIGVMGVGELLAAFGTAWQPADERARAPATAGSSRTSVGLAVTAQTDRVPVAAYGGSPATMQWMPYTVFAGLAIIAVVVGVVGGGVWWVVAGIGVVAVGSWLVVDRYLKRRESGGERAAAEVKPRQR